ncbi:MAG: chitosanase, partial [Anaerolineae bacterium]|nr:chitosanase [Anaerolineae bacterium]
SLSDANQVRTASFNITAGFEGGGYASFQNHDAGIVSYGRFQFTLAGSGLFAVLQRYTSRAQTATASDLRSVYLERTRNHDPNLREDTRLRQLLLDAANDPIMQAAQDEAATELYWNVVQQLSIVPRNIRTPLGQALIFDMGINFGPRHGFLGAAEQKLGVPPKSRLGENGAREEDLITVLAQLRKESHDRQAERDHLPGLKVRGDFWVSLIQKGDWPLQGDPDGTLLVKPGVRVKVRNF